MSNDKSSSPFGVLVSDNVEIVVDGISSVTDTYSATFQTLLSPSDVKLELSLSEKYMVSLPMPSSKLFTRL